MATGSLLFPLGYAPLHPTTGALVPSGKLYFYRTGTTTAQDTYSDSTLLGANANPVVLSSAGLLETNVYGNPSSGYNYRVRLYTSADVLLDTWDDVVCTQSNVATFSEGTFTGTLTGVDASTTGTIDYRIVSNIGGTGKLCTLWAAANILGTSNTTAMTLTGLPAACTPTDAVRVLCELQDNSVGGQVGHATIAAAGTTITFGVDAPISDTGFTNSNSKGIPAGWSITYAL